MLENNKKYRKKVEESVEIDRRYGEILGDWRITKNNEEFPLQIKRGATNEVQQTDRECSYENSYLVQIQADVICDFENFLGDSPMENDQFELHGLRSWNFLQGTRLEAR